MSKQLSKTRIYTEAEFKAGDRLERIGMHLLQNGLTLSPTEEHYKADLWKVFQIHSDSLSQLGTLKKLKDLFPRKKLSLLRQMITDAESVFGSLIQRNKDISRAVRIEKLTKIHEMAIDGVYVEELIQVPDPEADGGYRDQKVQRCLIEPDLKVATDAIKLIDKIESDMKDEQSIMDDLELGEIHFTTDPNALIQDIDHEEVDPE